MNGLLLQPGRDEEGLHQVRTVSQDGRLSLFQVERPPLPASHQATPACSPSACDKVPVFLTKLIKEPPDVEGLDAKRALGGYQFRNDQPTLVRKRAAQARPPSRGPLLRCASERLATWATVRPCSILLRRENKSFLDHSLPLLRSGCFGHSIHPQLPRLVVGELASGCQKGC